MGDDNNPVADPDDEYNPFLDPGGLTGNPFGGPSQALGDLLDDDSPDVLSEDETEYIHAWAANKNFRHAIAQEAAEHEADTSSPSPPSPSSSSLLAPFGFSPWFLVGVLAVIAAGVAFWLAGGSDGDRIAVDTAGEIVDNNTDSSPSTSLTEPPQTSLGSGSTTTAVVGATPASPEAGPTACAAAAEAPSTMTFSSPDVGPTISAEYSQRAAYAFGFPTPRFEWSGVPAAASELMITIQKVDNSRGEAVLASTDLDADGWPIGGVRWSASDISPSLTSLPESAFTSGDVPDPALLKLLPEGVVERTTGSAIVTIGDTQFDNKFIGPNRDGQVFLFTIYALCEPSVGSPVAYRPAWGRENAVDVAWFAAVADGL